MWSLAGHRDAFKTQKVISLNWVSVTDSYLSFCRPHCHTRGDLVSQVTNSRADTRPGFRRTTANSLRAKPDNVSSLVDEPQRISLVSSRYVQEERNKQTEKKEMKKRKEEQSKMKGGLSNEAKTPAYVPTFLYHLC